MMRIIVRSAATEATTPAWPPAGHFYSPVIDPNEVAKDRARIFDTSQPVAGIDMRAAGQLELLDQLATFYHDLPFGDEPVEGLRYNYRNPAFGYADGIILATMIRWARPSRIIEVGSGFSSCAILDVNERFFSNSIECTFIDPYTDLVRSLIREEDKRTTRIIQSRLQDIDTEVFAELGAGDILFVDSTHVSKCDSDVNHYLFRILPALAPGVIIHFHDIFHPFEYPEAWVLGEKRSWNEIYALRAFLMYNQGYEILFFNSFMFQTHKADLDRLMPKFANNSGGSLWLRKL